MKVVYCLSAAIAHPLSPERNKTDFKLTIQPDGRTTSIIASGELDIVSAPELAIALEEGHVADARLIILDLCGVTLSTAAASTS